MIPVAHPPSRGQSLARRNVHSGVTERTLDTHRAKTAIFIKEARDSYDSVQLQQGQRYCRVIQIHLTLSKLPDQVFRQRIDIDLQANRQSGRRTDTRAYTAKLFALIAS
jgi:hypothetical protein